MATVTERLAVIVEGNPAGGVGALRAVSAAAAQGERDVSKLNLTVERLGEKSATAGKVAGLSLAGGIAGVGGAVAGAVVAFAGLGVAAAKANAGVASQFGYLRDTVVKDMQGLAQPLVPVLVDVATRAADTFGKLEPALAGAFKAVAPDVTTLSNGLLGFANEVIPALARAAEHAGPVIDALSGGLTAVGRGLAGFLDQAEKGVPGAAAALHELFADVGLLLPPLGQLVGSLANAAGPIVHDLTPAVRLAGAAIRDAAVLVDDISAALGGLSGPAGKAAVALGGVVLAVKGFKAASSAVTSVRSAITAAATAAGNAVTKVGTLGDSLAKSDAANRAGRAYSNLGSGVKAAAAALPVLGLGIGVIGAALDESAAETQRATDYISSLYQTMAQGGAAGDRAAGSIHAISTALDRLGGKSGIFGGSLGKAFTDAKAQFDQYEASLSETDERTQAVAVAQNNLTSALSTSGATSNAVSSAAAAYNTALDRQQTLEHEVATAVQTTTQRYLEKFAALTGAAEADAQLKSSEDGVRQAQADVATAAKTSADAIRQHGRTSVEARQAALQYASAQDNLRQQILGAANQARSAAQAHAQGKSAEDQAKAGAAAYRTELGKLVGTLDPKSPLRRELQGLIAQLDAAGKDRTAHVTVAYSQTGIQVGQRGHGVEAHAAGGAVMAGRPVIVGENRPEVFIPSTSGSIRPSVADGKQEPATVVNNYITVGSRSVADEVAKAIRWELWKV